MKEQAGIHPFHCYIQNNKKVYARDLFPVVFAHGEAFELYNKQVP